jgi:hypothetical protein
MIGRLKSLLHKQSPPTRTKEQRGYSKPDLVLSCSAFKLDYGEIEEIYSNSLPCPPATSTSNLDAS